MTSVDKDGSRRISIIYDLDLLVAQFIATADGFDQHVKVKHINIRPFTITNRDGSKTQANITYYKITALNALNWDRHKPDIITTKDRIIENSYFAGQQSGAGFDVPAGLTYSIDTYAFSEDWNEYVKDSVILDFTK